MTLPRYSLASITIEAVVDGVVPGSVIFEVEPGGKRVAGRSAPVTITPTN